MISLPGFDCFSKWVLGAISVATIICLLFSCSPKKATLFSELSSEITSITFRNDLAETNEKNVLSYIYFYNGGGVAAGDLNNDGLSDLVFTGNQKTNKVYINKGNFNFEDISIFSGVGIDSGWSTGVSMIDINSDGWLDIYVCLSGDSNPNKRKNRLYINNQNKTFTERASTYGLDDPGYSTHSAFFDYDKDGDLDMFLLNHSIHYFEVNNEFSRLKDRFDKNFGSKLYQNQNGFYVDVSEKAGIVSNFISFGLGVAIGDVNHDGWPDVYVSNDFKEQDYLYINKGDGTFANELEERMDHISMFSMGSDMEDVNNDGHLDLLTIDMLPPDNFRLKMTSGAENFDKFKILHEAGFSWQYMRNMFHLNNGDGTFSEIGSLAGISNTDWSWAPLFADFDNDGNKDLFVTNGYFRDYTNMDFFKFLVDYQIQLNATGKELTPLEIIQKMPSSKLSNYFFRNDGNLHFTSTSEEWGLTKTGISSGATYVDLDNDGDLDLAINNVNDLASIYKNNSQIEIGNNSIGIRLKGKSQNKQAIGAKLKMYSGNLRIYREHYLSRGYESSVDQVIHFGLGKKDRVDSIEIIWPDGKIQNIRNPTINTTIDVVEDGHKIVPLLEQKRLFFEPTKSTIAHTHNENDFNDFKVQSLLPHFLSRSGPCMAKADINGDGMEDLFVGGAKGFSGRFFIQSKEGLWAQLKSKILELDSVHEDTDAIFFDCDKDGDQDLYVVSGGYEFLPNSKDLRDRLYLNDGNGNFSKSEFLPEISASKSCVKVADFDNDGDEDLFVGGRLVPGSYPQSPNSFLLSNDGSGKMTDSSINFSGGSLLGMVLDAAWVDINKDGWQDLIIVGEWMSIKIMINHKGIFYDESLGFLKKSHSGWWNKILASDLDKDGDIDLVIGNLGLNAQIKATHNEPVKIFFRDIDDNGSVDPIISSFVQGKQFPMPFLDDLTAQVPSLKKKFLLYKDYSSADMDDVLGVPEANCPSLLADTFQSMVLINNNGILESIELPMQAQFSPIFSILSFDVNFDGFEDIILAGNQTQTRIRFGRYDANHGMLFLGDGKCGFTYVPQLQSGFNIRGDVRSTLRIGNNLFFGINSDKVLTYTWIKSIN